MKETKKTIEQNERDLDDIASMMISKQPEFDLAEATEALTKDLKNRGLTIINPQTLTAVIFGIDMLQSLVNHHVDGEAKMQLLKLFSTAELPIRAIKRNLEQGYKPTGKIKPATLALMGGSMPSGKSSDYSGHEDDEDGKHYGFKS